MRLSDFEGRNVYLSGPMTGLTYCNVDGFARVHQLVHEAGARTIYDPAISYLTSHQREGDLTHSEWVRQSVGRLVREPWDVLVSLPGWEDSDGALIEREVAVACEIATVDWEDVEGGDQ